MTLLAPATFIDIMIINQEHVIVEYIGTPWSIGEVPSLMHVSNLKTARTKESSPLDCESKDYGLISSNGGSDKLAGRIALSGL
jgi:hypothetical protein